MTRVALPLGLLAGAAVASAAAASPPGPARAAATLIFLAAAPGLAVVPLLRLEGVLAPALAVVAASLVLDGIVAETLVLARVWSPALALGLLVGVTAAGAAGQLVLGTRERRS